MKKIIHLEITKIVLLNPYRKIYNLYENVKKTLRTKYSWCDFQTVNMMLGKMAMG